MTRGTRGHSSLKGAVDTEVEISHDKQLKIFTAEVTKQKDLEQGQRFPFRLVPSVVGMNERGKKVTSCIVAHLDESEAPEKKKVGRRALHVAHDLLELLPQPTVKAWLESADSELGIKSSHFYDLKKGLVLDIDYKKGKCGELEATGMIKNKGNSGNSGNSGN